MSAVAASPNAFSPSLTFRRLLGNGTLIAFVIYIIFYAIYASRQPDALSGSAIMELMNNSLPLALAAGGGTLVVLTRGFDLSVAGVMALSNVIIATQVGGGVQGALLGLAMVVAVGLTVGAINGALVAYARLQSIASTLATMIVCSGASLLVLNAPGGNVPNFIANDLTGVVAGVPVAALIAGVVVLIWLAVRRTDWGVGLYATGADETAAGLAGIDTRRVKFIAYCLAGVMYALAGYMLSALTATGDPNSGTSYLLLTFAAIALGGTAFTGGRGGVVGSMIGAAILALLEKLLFSIGVASFYTGIFQGIVMVVAILLAAFSERLSHRVGAS
ncbi:MAG: ABC transporter permease [Acetobacteraceae bacterium]